MKFLIVKNVKNNRALPFGTNRKRSVTAVFVTVVKKTVSLVLGQAWVYCKVSRVCTYVILVTMTVKFRSKEAKQNKTCH